MINIRDKITVCICCISYKVITIHFKNANARFRWQGHFKTQAVLSKIIFAYWLVVDIICKNILFDKEEQMQAAT